jgi:hypothetical protein
VAGRAEAFTLNLASTDLRVVDAKALLTTAIPSKFKAFSGSCFSSHCTSRISETISTTMRFQELVRSHEFHYWWASNLPNMQKAQLRLAAIPRHTTTKPMRNFDKAQSDMQSHLQCKQQAESSLPRPGSRM